MVDVDDQCVGAYCETINVDWLSQRSIDCVNDFVSTRNLCGETGVSVQKEETVFDRHAAPSTMCMCVCV